ncbi:MAG TPA: IPT/TIG domain-containing protein [Chitinophagaceae bacterium]|nr:IPT/TIG domain-containing protein [Chitinophagaceae bacterium]
MIKLSSFKLLALIGLVLSIGIVTSCDKDDDEVNSDKTELFSFGPTGAKHGDTIRFIGANLNRVTAITFTGPNATINQTDFKQQTNDLIRLIVPQSAEKGYVTLKTPEGDIVTKTEFNLDVLTTITSITPQARPGEDITITGNYLNWVDRVTFSRDKVVETFVSKVMDKLVVKVPDDAQTGPLILHYTGTDSNYVETTDTLKVTLPLSTSLSPNPVKPLTDLTIAGTNLDLVKKIIFNGVSAPVTTFVSQSATQLVVKVPDAAKKGKLTLEAASGVKTLSGDDLDIVLPVITDLSPNPINLAADLTITGTDLDLVKKVIFSGVAPAVTTFVSQSTTQLVVKVPAGARDGKVRLEAASTVQTTSSNDLDIVLPAITGLSPSPIDPFQDLTITGTGFDVVTSVVFLNVPPVTSFVSQSATQIVVKVPNGALKGKVAVGVSNPSDTVQSSDILEITGLPPLADFTFPIYTDAAQNGFQDWSYTVTHDFANTENVRQGTKAIKAVYGGNTYQGITFHNGSTLSTSGYTKLEFSVFAEPSLNGKKLQVVTNGSYSGSVPQVTLVGGEWTTFSVTLSSMGSPTGISEIVLQAAGFTGTVYIDHVGLR